jgi:hypothetical protein
MSLEPNGDKPSMLRMSILYTMGQFGSRPHRNTTNPVFLEELQLQVSRISTKSKVLTHFDGRIIPNLAMIATRKYGVPSMVTQ